MQAEPRQRPVAILACCHPCSTFQREGNEEHLAMHIDLLLETANNLARHLVLSTWFRIELYICGIVSPMSCMSLHDGKIVGAWCVMPSMCAMLS